MLRGGLDLGQGLEGKNQYQLYQLPLVENLLYYCLISIIVLGGR